MLSDTLGKIVSINGHHAEAAQRRLDSLTKPQGSLGRLEEFAKKLAAIAGTNAPCIDKKVIFTFAGDHGVTEEGVSAFPKEVTKQMVLNFISGGAAINVLARHAGAEVVVIDIGVDHDFQDLPGLIKRKVVSGTKNMATGPAMTHEQAQKSIEVGMELAVDYASRGYNLFGTGDMGIGNTTPSSAIASVMTGRQVSDVTGKGTGITNEALAAKIRTIEKAIEVNQPDASDGLDVLAKVGGAEIGGIAGVCLGAAACGVPVVVDGFISTAGALIAYALEPRVRDYMFSAHLSEEAGHKAMLQKIGLKPMLDFDLRLGEGTGSALAMHLLEAAVRIYIEMATFGDAGVSEKSD